jgi:hypothetical protein
MTVDGYDWATWLLWTGVKIVVLTGGLVVVMLMVDPFYFDQPLAVAEAGLEPAQAPPPPFATSVVFGAELGDPVKFALGAREVNTRARVEVLQPSGLTIYDRELEIVKPTVAATRQGWQTFSIGIAESGTYTLRITQQNPGIIKVYLFQGPFLARMIFLPFFAAFLARR